MTEHKTQYVGQCRYDEGQRLQACINGASVVVEAFAGDEQVTEPFLTPADARAFARGILALADEVDGGEVVATEPADEPTVRDVTEYDIRVDGDGANGLWYLNPDDVEKVDDEPVIAASKIVVLDDSAPSRAALLEQAMDLMSGSQTYTATDLTELADYLAEEK
jgi:hypothetical protein